MDPEILRRKAAANGNGVATNGHTSALAVLSAAVKAGAVKTTNGLVANGDTGVPAVNGSSKIIDSVAA